MIRGIYAAGAGMLTESVRTDVIANNLANANTAGYKKDMAVVKDFHSLLIQRINDGANRPAIGSLGVGSMVDEVVTVHDSSGMRQTGNQYDMAIEGPGYFAVETPAGTRYTRNGTFTRSAQGELVTQDGYRVLGQGGPIQLGDTRTTVEIAEDGRVMVDNAETDTIRIAVFADEKRLIKEGSSLYAAGDQREEPAPATLIRPGYLELSNVNPVSEMVSLITAYRAYEINSKAIHAHDQLLDKAVNEVGRV